MSQTPVVIKVDRFTERMRYTFDFVFDARGFHYTLVTEGTAFDLDYSNSSSFCSGLLYEEGVSETLPSWNDDRNVFVFDGVADPFASIFYVLSRMEEYQISKRDAHGRFGSASSLQHKYGVLELPVCDVWATFIHEELLNNTLPAQDVRIAPTFDIDNTYAYKYKTGKRRFLSTARDIVKRNKKRLSERKAVDRGAQDPYDTFETIIGIAKTFDTKVFWLIESNGAYDRNLDIGHPEHQKLLNHVGEYASIGIHPSYDSFQNYEAVWEQREKLGMITGERIFSSRQHYLRFDLPNSYRILLKAGITDDYSMGYADAVGFRCGTARSVRWFDVEREEVTLLMLHPFIYMDGTLNEYLEWTTEKSKEVIASLFGRVQDYGGDFRFIWHNETIGDYGKWNGWRSVLDFTLKLGEER